MLQHIETENRTDENGNPAGGFVNGVGLDIEWQNGPLVVDGRRVDPTGAFVETVIQAAIQRIEHYQESRFECMENANALIHLNQAMGWLKTRTERRTSDGTEGTHSGN